MKPGYKILITGALVYGGFQIKSLMDRKPYREHAVQFTVLLKQHRGFEAQALLSPALQSQVSVEALRRLAEAEHIAESGEISWSDWRGDDGNYTLQGSFVWGEEKRVPVFFELYRSGSHEIQIDRFKIGNKVLGEAHSLGFLE